MSVKKQRIGSPLAIVLILFALIADLIQGLFGIVPFVGWIISPGIGILIGLILFVWFSLLGAKLLGTKKKIVLWLIVPIIELIPIVNILPAWTLATAISIFIIRAEDRLLTTRGQAKLNRLLRGSEVSSAGIELSGEGKKELEKTARQIDIPFITQRQSLVRNKTILDIHAAKNQSRGLPTGRIETPLYNKPNA